jgi:hypothetical protein
MKYRYLKKGEIIKKGDEYLSHFLHKWFPTQNVGAKIKNQQYHVYRRPVTRGHPVTKIFK